MGEVLKGMEDGSTVFKRDAISVTELKRLLHEIHDHRPDLCVRVRLLGKMWMTSFYRVFLVTENGLVLANEKSNETEIITNLLDIVQFELDGRFQLYHPNYHYSVLAFES